MSTTTHERVHLPVLDSLAPPRSTTPRTAELGRLAMLVLRRGGDSTEDVVVVAGILSGLTLALLAWL